MPDPCEFPYIRGGAPVDWSLKEDRLGFCDYEVMYIVAVDPLTMGPFAARNCPGLPTPGEMWDIEADGAHTSAFFTKEKDIKHHGRDADNQFFKVTLHATTRPVADCYTEDRDDPLTVPDRIRIQTVTYQNEARFDRDGFAVLNSAWEQFRGKQVEVDTHRLRVYIEQNHATQDLDLVQSLMHTLNDAELWGFPVRTIKLSEFEAEPKFYQDCQKYWLRKFTFDVSNDFDPCLLDEGTKVLRGQWDRNPTSPTYGQYILGKKFMSGFPPTLVPVDPLDPKDFMRFKDWHNENARVLLNGHGKPYDPRHVTPGTDDDVLGKICYELYDEGNFNLLDIPLIIE